jgi:hypothetical protein
MFGLVPASLLLAACVASPQGNHGATTSAAAPLIVVESPVPGEEVSRSFEVTGTSNTFEANLRYRLVDHAGRTVDDGYATATAGGGTWGQFSFDVVAPADGEHVLELWQPDLRTGGRRDLVRVPVTVR